MKPIILQLLDDVTDYTNTTFDAVLQVGATRLQSIKFSVTILAGQTTAIIPTDNFDINADTILLDLNTRSGAHDAVITQELGQRAVVTVPVFDEDTVVSGVILKNTIVTQGDVTVNGSVIKINTLPTDRLLSIPETADGVFITSHTLSPKAINSEDWDEAYSDFDVNGVAKTTIYSDSSGKVKEVSLSNPNGDLNYLTITVDYFKDGNPVPYLTKVGTATYSGLNRTGLTWV